jgi:hypothetical protein
VEKPESERIFYHRDRSIFNTDSNSDADMHTINNRNENANHSGINKYKMTKVSKVFLILLIRCLKLFTSQTLASCNSNNKYSNKYSNLNLGCETICTPAVATISARRLRLHDSDDRCDGILLISNLPKASGRLSIGESKR